MHTDEPVLMHKILLNVLIYYELFHIEYYIDEALCKKKMSLGDKPFRKN